MLNLYLTFTFFYRSYYRSLVTEKSTKFTRKKMNKEKLFDRSSTQLVNK